MPPPRIWVPRHARVEIELIEKEWSDGLPQCRAASTRALDQSGEEVEVALSRETAERASRWFDARARAEEILIPPGNAEITPTEAAVPLGMSRLQVSKLMDRGLLEFREVGTDHRIRVSSIRAFLGSERAPSPRSAGPTRCGHSTNVTPPLYTALSNESRSATVVRDIWSWTAALVSRSSSTSAISD